MNLKEAKKRNSMRGGQDDYSLGFIEGYEQGVNDAASFLHCWQPEFEQPDKCPSCVLKELILKLLDEVKK